MNIKYLALFFAVSFGINTTFSMDDIDTILTAIETENIKEVESIINKKDYDINNKLTYLYGETSPLEFAVLEALGRRSQNIKRENIMNIIRLLLKKGADVNIQDEYLDTPLHLATSTDDSEIVEILLEHGADIFIKNENGLTPYDVAVEENNKEIKDMFDRHKMSSGLSRVHARPKGKDVFISLK